MNKAKNAPLSLRFVGGAGGVTGSKFLINFGTDQLLLDCGLFQGLKELRLRNWSPPPFDAARLSAIVLTHAHIDHSGYLPRLVARGFRGPVFATPATCDLLKIMLLDAAYLQEEEARYANKAGYSKHHPALPLYTVEDAERSLRLLAPTKFGDEISVRDEVGAKFLRVGHILGAAAVRIGFGSGSQRKFLVDSGDLGRYGRPILKDPEPVKSADWLLLEATYGDRLHSKDPESELASLINSVAERQGVLIIPSFAVGRMQDLIYTIRALEDAGKIPVLPVHIDSPMAIEATGIYAGRTEEHDPDMQVLAGKDRDPLRSRRFYIHRTPEESKAVNNLSGPFILLTSSGMMTGGRVLHHLRQRLPDPEATILLVGYQAEGTRGRDLQEGAKTLKMFGQMIPVRARTVVIDGFSAHADQAEILRWLENFQRPPKQTYLVHGEAAAAAALAEAIRARFKWKVDVPALGDTATLS